MKHIKTVEVPATEIPATTRQWVDFVTCDLCGARLIAVGSYIVDEVEVRHRTGTRFPEGGGGEETSVDMCGRCFDEKLVPWLRSKGAEPRIEDWDS